MAIKMWCILVLCTHLLAHKIEGINLLITPLENDMIAIEGKMKGSQKRLEGNKVALISMIDKRVIFEAFLEGGKPLHVKIPEESYWVYLYIGDQDVVEEGMAPKEGFKKIAHSQKERAFRIMGGLALGFIGLFFLTVCLRLYWHKRIT
ncbi:hypothetical protein [Sulfurospirillum barnesii]|uniref:Uncharacterized protein n=1 Tax=Sulfurospirillum barnesii (strain ATCC 700032 / DSM 10660 / SES-3) TaxID=760154 RepID=I3XY71_SULBS|nr:hypothetical protein [Sulfurospirillum barnesii]AFL68895.1 hypothetical protein Sulba_1607 [Sulfurospirillum barnesii SES-3]